MSNLLLAPKSTQSVVKEQFLQLHLAQETVLLTTAQIREIMTISAEGIMPIPDLSPSIMGVSNYRGESLWLADLGALIGFTPLYQQVLPTSTYTLVVLQVVASNQTVQEDRDCQLGLVVNRVGNIERCDRSELQNSLSTTGTQLTKFLQGYWLKSEREICPVLDPDAIWSMVARG